MLAFAILAAILLMGWFHRWLDRSTLQMPSERLVLEMQRMIGVTSTASGLCVLLLAGYSARLGRRVAGNGQRPVPQVRQDRGRWCSPRPWRYECCD